MNDDPSIGQSSPNLSPTATPQLQLGARLIGPGQPVYIIAEVSGNHGQDLATARALVLAAKSAGASAVKFQTFTPEEIAAPGVVVPRGHGAAHDRWLDTLGVTELRDLFRYGGLPRAWHRPLKAVADDVGLVFLSTPFSVDAAQFLVEEIGVPALKIASGDLTFTPLLVYAASTGLPVLLSTGGATMQEIHDAVSIEGGPLWPAYEAGRLALLHCVSAYPCPYAAANLRAIDLLQAYFPRAVVGWSDHTRSDELIPVLAVLQGATIVEKHLCWELTLPQHVDAGHSLAPVEFAHMVEAIRALPQILGTGEKVPHALEAHDRLWARRDPSDCLRPTAAARQGRWT